MNLDELIAQVHTMRARSTRSRPRTSTHGDSWFSIQQKDDTAEVSIYEEIGLWGVTAKAFADQLGAIKASTIKLRINSPGGDVADGLAIYNTLVRHSARVIATVDGWAASAASFILQAADERLVAAHSLTMIHEAWGLAIGTADEIEAQARLLRKASDMTADIYAERSGQPISQIIEAMKAETWYTAEEAIAAGLADRIDESTTTTGEQDPRNRWDLSIHNSILDPQPHPVDVQVDAIRRALKEAFA